MSSTEPGTHVASPTATADPPATASAPETTSVSANESQEPAAPQPAAVPENAATSDGEEPQNALTQQFTEAEWKALKEFRTQLPEIFSEAYDGKKVESINLWGVTIDANNPKNARTSVVLMKFLRARNNNVSAARTMLIATLRWREQFNIEAVMKEEFPQDVYGKLGHVYGRDSGGRPVVYNLYGANKDLSAVFGDVQRFLRWRVALMEDSIKMLDFETVDQTTQIHDYHGVSLWSGRDANAKNAAAEASSVFNNHYPELLYKKFFVNAPTLLNWMFWLFKPLLPAKTLAKMTVVGSHAHDLSTALLAVIPEKELPKRYGGQAEPDW